MAQRNRTRRAIVEAAMRLLAGGTAPSMAEVAEAAEVSRRTVYMYFPTLEQLLIDATLGALTQNTIDPVLTDSASNDPVVRAEQLSHALNSHSAETLHLGRALIRLTVEADAPAPGVPRRGYRRVQWIERALAPAREELTAREFERLVSALSVLDGLGTHYRSQRHSLSRPEAGRRGAEICGPGRCGEGAERGPASAQGPWSTGLTPISRRQITERNERKRRTGELSKLKTVSPEGSRKKRCQVLFAPELL